jgi:hypothetical protein
MSRRYSRPRSALLVTLVAFLPVGRALARAGSRPASAAGTVALEGRLRASGGACPALEVRGKRYPLAAAKDYLQATLADPRLNGRQVRIEGVEKPDGTLSVEKFYTVKDGRLYRVRYYCETCHIAYLQPGLCYCCQQPTELQELPLSDTDDDTMADP